MIWSCLNETLDLALDIVRALDSIIERKERKQAFRMELGGMSSSIISGNIFSPCVGASASRPSGSGAPRGVGIHSYFQPWTTPGSQP